MGGKVPSPGTSYILMEEPSVMYLFYVKTFVQRTSVYKEWQKKIKKNNIVSYNIMYRLFVL